MNKIKTTLFLIFIEIATSLILKENLNDWKADFISCTRGDDVNKCFEKKFASKGYQCCKSKILETKGDKTDEGEKCDIGSNPMQPETNNDKIMAKEYLGFQIFYYDRKISRLENNYTCSDGKINYIIDQNDYTEEEKVKLKDKNHCLAHTESTSNITKETCFNSVLSITGNSGVSCGFFQSKLFSNDSTTIDYNYCYLFDDDVLTKKNMGILLKTALLINSVSESRSLNDLSKFQVTMTNSKGQSATYYSDTDSIIVNNNNGGDTISAKFLNYRYLLLIILLFI